MKTLILVAIAAVLLASSVQGQSIVDFTYS